jgi:hypothetical protein
MARPRLELDNQLRSILGSANVYFQPPENTQMKYPCIVYNVDSVFDLFADNRKYLYDKGYMVTYIDWDPDSPVLEALLKMPMCSFVRHYESDGLNHDVFLIYF